MTLSMAAPFLVVIRKLSMFRLRPLVQGRYRDIYGSALIDSPLLIQVCYVIT